MARKFHCFVLISILIPRTDCEMCDSRTNSGGIKQVCCADYEAKHGACIACSEGYTSYTGQNCRPCPNNTYGERCRYDCSCSFFQSCDSVKGCVEIQANTESLVHKTPDTTTLLRDLDASTNGEGNEKSMHELLSTEMIVIVTLTVVVVFCGVCLCLVFYKYKLVGKKTPTISQSPNIQEPQRNSIIEMEDRLYDIINDADMLDDDHLQQMQVSSTYLDVISASNSIESSKGRSEMNLDFPCHHLPYSGTEKHENDVVCSSVISGDNTSSSDEEHHDTNQDYLNPYQPLIKISPPKNDVYLTLAKVDSYLPGFQNSVTIENECVLQVGVAVLRQLHEHKKFQNKFECRNSQRCFNQLKDMYLSHVKI